MMTLFENLFAELKLPYEQLPQCIDVRRVLVSRDPYRSPRALRSRTSLFTTIENNKPQRM